MRPRWTTPSVFVWSVTVKRNASWPRVLTRRQAEASSRSLLPLLGRSRGAGGDRRPPSRRSFVFVAALGVVRLHARLLMSVRVRACDLAGFFVFELAVHVLLLAGKVAVCVSRMVLRLLGTSVRAHDLVDPAPEAADPHVQRGGGRVGAAVTPGDDPGEDPSAGLLLLAHQPASRVALATVAMEEAGVWRTAGAQRAVAGEAVAIALLALPWRHQRDPGGDNGV